MRMLLLWPWPDLYPIKFAKDEPIDQFWPNGNDALSIGASLKARLEAGEYTHLFLHYRLGTATADAEGGFDANKAVEDVLDTLRENPLAIAPSVEYVIVYGNYSGSREVDREVNDFIHRLMVIAAPLFRGATDDLRSRIHSVNTRQLFRQPAHSPQKKSMALYGKLIGSIACDAFKLGTAQDDPNFYFRPSNLRAQVFLDQIGHARFMGAEALNRFEIATLSAYRSDDEGNAEYLVDSPYRDYFQAINEHIERNNLERLFHEGQNPERPYLDEAMVFYEYAYDEVRNVYTPFTIECSNDLVKYKEEFLPLLPLLHTSAFYCEEKAWSGAVQEQQTPTKKNGSSKLIRLAFVMHRLESGKFKGTLNYALIPRSGSSGMPWSVDLEKQAFDVLRPLVEATAIAALSPILSAKLKLANDELEKAGRTASLSQVLARTLSHNLGSHSLNAFATEDGMRMQFERIEALIEKKTLLPGRIVGVDSAPLDHSDLSKQRREWLARYNNYLRERMDLLADITTAVPAFEAKTHLVGDILNGYANNVLLATTIAGNHEFDYGWIPQLNGAEDVLVSIPADILGRHAFYIILENIVRNSAKHGQHGSHTVDYTVKVEPIGTHPGYLKVTILDNHPGRTADEARQRAAEANGNINATVLGDDGRVRSNAWGMLEMKACAAYLRRVALEDLDEAKYRARMLPPGSNELPQLSKTDEPPLLEAVSEGTRLGYTFYLQRPKDVMVMGSDRESVFGTTQRSVLDQHGVGFTSADAIQENKVIQHALLVVDARDDRVLEAFLERARNDMNALPHEILLIVGGEQNAEAIKIAIAARKNNDAPISVLLDSIQVMDKSEWETIVSGQINEIYTRLRRRWQVGWMKARKLKVNTCSVAFRSYRRDTSSELGSSTIEAEASYEAHGDFYAMVDHYIGGNPHSAPDSSVATLTKEDFRKAPDLSGHIRRWFLSGKIPIVQSYPSALDRVMAPADATSAMSVVEWAQHHFTSWFKGVAVIDERVQRSAESDMYVPKAKDDAPPPAPVSVKHLLAMGRVFVPPGSPLHLEKELTAQKWEELLLWVKGLEGMIRYVCIHLTILEKFASVVAVPGQKAATLEDLLRMLKASSPLVRVVIVSGRGKPGNLPSGELFMSYSALSQYTTQAYQRAPVLLTMLCHSTRRLI